MTPDEDDIEDTGFGPLEDEDFDDEDDAPPLLDMLPLVSEAGAYHLPAEHIDALLDAARDLDFLAVNIGLTQCRDKEELIRRIAQALAIPGWFGGNWDALADSINDLEWLGEAEGYVLVFDHGEDLRAASSYDYDELIELLTEAAERWREVDIPFWAFFGETDA